VLAEVVDAAQSVASLHRPGLDRVRDLVAAGGVAAMLVQDADRLARDHERHRLLRHEFEARGCRLGVLNGYRARPGKPSPRTSRP
jgi:site-specific DNA recombinase